jgi:mannosyltransferase OCH1-like enzyme
MIPKIIHYCWLGSEPYSDKIINCMESWKKHLSAYEFKKWDAKTFDVGSVQWVKEAYESKKYAFAVDYIRFFAVYNYGGIYLDTDIEIIKPFDPLLAGPYMLAYENDKTKFIESGCFGAEKGSRFVKECLEYYNGRPFIRQDKTYDMLEVPVIMKSVYDKSCIENIDFYSSSFFTVKDLKTGELAITADTYCIHHFAGSWLTDEERKYYQLKRTINKLFGVYLGFFLSVLTFVVFSIKNYGILNGMKKVTQKINKYFN